MAYINVAEWTPDQVTDWLKGLDDTMYNYIYSFTNNEVGGRQLLNIRPYELKQLGMHSIGHQEIVLEAVEILRNFHYNLDKENLQFMALHVAAAARNLHRRLASHRDVSNIETQVLNDITRTIATIQPIIGWLDRAPFHGQLQFKEIRRNMLRLGLEMATSAQRDRFVQNPVEQIKATAEKLERLANYIIQDITDPMLLQPASLNLVTLKKRESELGFNIVSSYHGIHRVTDIKYNSPAHNSGKIEDGDEIVQINYQTVVGWQYKTVIMQLRESLPDVLLTLKKRPKHMKIYGQIYMQPYRLPSKKRNMASRWGENLPSPRAGFLAAPNFTTLPIKINKKATSAAVAVSVGGGGGGGASSDTDSSGSDILTPTDTKSAEKEIRLYYPKPRAMLQRRNTISGDELFGKQYHVGGVPMWHERKVGATQGDPASPSLRDKSISFGFGLELTPRPTTCIGLASGAGGTAKFSTGDLKGSLSELKTKDKLKLTVDVSSLDKIQQEETSKSKPGVSKVVRFGGNMKYTDYRMDEKYTCNVEDTILETFEPIPFADDEEAEILEGQQNKETEGIENLHMEEVVKPLESILQLQPAVVEAINSGTVGSAVRRGRLDKSHSTPAYDNSEGESDTPPPAIEPRKEFLLVTPPAPPPRPKKQSELAPPDVPPPPPKPANFRQSCDTLAKPPAAVPIFPATETLQESDAAVMLIPSVKTITPDGNELHTPPRTKTLTLKKKNSLISKRRKINLKLLGTGDIQGHLYRRTKDRRGVTYWARFYFVLLDIYLYCFRTKEALKANCLIFLPGFTVSLAKEVHSKSYAFKVYHPSKTFYFATESQEALNQWIDFIRQATLLSEVGVPMSSAHFAGEGVSVKQLYSETESSGEETETLTINKNLSMPSPQGAAVKNSVALSASSSFNTPTSSSTAKSDKRYLGSLRKFTKSSFISKSSSQSERKVSSDIPVPTEQYRSYRKVPGGSFGIQIGTNTPGYHDITLNSLGSSVMSRNTFTKVKPPSMPQRKLSLSSIRTSVISISGADSVASHSLAPPSTPAPALNIAPTPSNLTVPPPPLSTHRRGKLTVSHASSSPNTLDGSSKCFKKAFPCNFIHASNPNLVEFDFQTSKTLDYSLPKVNAANAWDAHQTIQGFLTLKDLMLQKQEEDAQEMYNNRVLLGVEKKNETFITNQRNNEDPQTQLDLTNNDQQKQQQQNPQLQEKWTQKRSLPKTPDYEISFKPDDEDIKRTRTKEGLKLRDFGYELISGDEPVSGNTVGSVLTRHNFTEPSTYNEHNWTAAIKTRQLLKSQHISLSQPKGNKKHSSNSCSSTTSAASEIGFITGSSAGEKRAGSFKKKGKLEAFKTSKDRLFIFTKHVTPASAAQSSMTMTLPLNRKLADNSTEQVSASASGGIKKSHTYNSELKDKVNVTPVVAKENKILGSPLLHRTLFGHQANVHSQIAGVSVGGGSGSGDLSPLMIATTTTSTACCTGREYDHEIFSQVLFTKAPSYHSESAAKFRHLSSSNCNIVAPDVLAPPPPVLSHETATHEAPPLPPHASDSSRGLATAIPASVTPEYPNIECPPVFEPEIYSLTDPNANLTFLRRRNNNSNPAVVIAEGQQH